MRPSRKRWSSERLAEGVLFADGAMGTMLSSAGLRPGECPEEWNVTHPEEVTAVHQAYADAGSELMLTNTFGGSGIKLSRFGMRDRVTELNSGAVEAARGVEGVCVAASIGPTGEFIEPLGQVSRSEMVAVYSEQIAACREADIVWIETMMDLSEARVAVEAARRTVDLPVALTFTYDETPAGPRTMMGVSPSDVAEEFGDVDVLGANCTTVGACLAAAQAYRTGVPDMPLAAKPNAGMPRFEAGRTVFTLDAAGFTDEVAALKEIVAILGGCCGTTPEHIATLADTAADA